MKKRLLLYTAYGTLKGNIVTLYEYYNNFLKEKFDDKLEVVFVDAKDIDSGRFGGLLSFLRRNLALFCTRLMVKGNFDYWVTDSGGNFLSKLSNGIEIAHGYGTKQSPGKNEIGTFKIRLLEKYFLKKLDAFITLSDFDKEYFYPIDLVKHHAEYLPLGLPRNDRLMDFKANEKLRETFNKRFNINAEAKLFLYAPTWREYSCSNSNKEKLAKINEILEEKNAYFLYRPHHHGAVFEENDLNELSRFILIDSTIVPDTQEALSVADCLITDYSSIFVDFLLLNKPIIFFVFDLEEYALNRGLVIDYTDRIMTPGTKVRSYDELLIEMEKIMENEDLFYEDRQKSINFFHKHADNKSCERVWEYLLQKLDLKCISEGNCE